MEQRLIRSYKLMNKTSGTLFKKMLRLNAGCLVMLLFVVSCVGSDDEKDLMEPTEVTYEADIEPITGTICVMCHMDPPINGAPMPLTTYEQVRNAVETRGLLNRINSSTNPMPPSGLLEENLRERFQAWADQDFPEN